MLGNIGGTFGVFIMDALKRLRPMTKTAATSLFGDIPPPKSDTNDEDTSHSLAQPSPKPTTSKKRGDRDESVSDAVASTEGSEEGDAKKARQPMDTGSVLKRITSGLCHAKPGPKLELAVKLFTQFITSCNMTEMIDGVPLSTVLFESVRAVVTPLPTKCVKGERLHALSDVMKALKRVAGDDWTPFTDEQRPLLDVWYVATVVNADVTTDDTYQYVNAVAKVKPYVLAYNTNEDTSPLQTEIAEMLMVVLASLYDMYKYTWARVPLDDVFKEASMRRLHFSKSKREQLDKWFSTLAARRSGMTAVVSKAPTVATGGTYHPLRNAPISSGTATTTFPNTSSTSSSKK